MTHFHIHNLQFANLLQPGVAISSSEYFSSTNMLCEHSKHQYVRCHVRKVKEFFTGYMKTIRKYSFALIIFLLQNENKKNHKVLF